MPETPETTPAMSDEEFQEALSNVRVQFWICLNPDHRNVEWDGDIATCPDCGLTSEMTQRYAVRVRAKIAEEILTGRGPDVWKMPDSTGWVDNRDRDHAARIARGEQP